MIRRTALLAGMLTIGTPALAQTSPYATEAPRTIQALSDDDVSSLLDGAGMGFARAAELNGVPGPRHSLDMAADLHLDDAQTARLEDAFIRMQTRARQLGREIVAREQELDALFAGGHISAAEVERRSTELGVLYGQLRAAHLMAHLEAASVLHPAQVRRYVALRGYGGAAGGSPGEHDSHH